MESIVELPTSQPIVYAILILSTVIVGGLVIGSIRIRGIRLGSAGVLSGSVTDPPALAFASGVCWSEAPFLAYATVYPLTMVVRVVAVQVLVLSMV